jgi:CBS domain
MRVKDIMTPNVICVGADEAVVNAARLMLQHQISGLPVVDKEGELIGIVTEGDFLRRSELGTSRRVDPQTASRVTTASSLCGRISRVPEPIRQHAPLVIARQTGNSRSFGPLCLAPPVEYAADAAASVERSLLPRVQGVIKRLKLGLDCLQAGKPDLRHLFGERHSTRRRRKIRLVGT